MKIPAMTVFPATLAIILSSSFSAIAQDAGEAAFAKQCARCHTVAKAVDFMKAHPDAKERAAWLERKLSRHHARDASQRKDIIAFMERVYGDAQKKK